MVGRRIVVATRSVHKLAELRRLLDLPSSTLVTLDEVGVQGEPIEDGETFAANAAIKARWTAERTGLPTLADDSGIEVEALDGGPGVRTRRFAGEHASDEANNAKLLTELSARGADQPAERGARYICLLAFVDPALSPGGAGSRDAPILAEGIFAGRIAEHERGNGGFGYDPIFEPDFEPPGGRTVGEMTDAEKDAVSHRARAATSMGAQLRRLGY